MHINFAKRLDTYQGQKNPDLIISELLENGDLSKFLAMANNATLNFTFWRMKMWPDFSKQSNFRNAIDCYKARERKFGNLKENSKLSVYHTKLSLLHKSISKLISENLAR